MGRVPLTVLTRREFLIASLLAPALTRLQPPEGGRLLGTIPFGATGNAVTPLDRLLGNGRDARLFSDLSKLSPTDRVTPTERFFVRTAAAPSLPPAIGWTVSVGGLVREATTIDIPSLEKLSRPGGRSLIECSGNADAANYGLMSVGEWEGVPLAAILDRMAPGTAAHRILVSGFDDESAQSRTSVPGASWIFSHDDLREAVLALRMNGAPLTRDHGAPVRLVVPGWYGCACIKWVNRIDVVADDVAATSQMWEFAKRTHQPFDPLTGIGSLRARDFIPAVIDTAATPVRIEQWAIDGTIQYRVIGIMWGGTTPTNALAIRFRADEPWVPVETCPLPASTRTWSLWTHTWRPAARGRYDIVLKVTDPSIRTRRLDLFYYVRQAVIEEV
jgi:DMSO/TMAO reductase YedYZ molybdopterin-dependent catalytic subunit